MPQSEIRKQITLFLPLSDWQAIRMEAARLKVPVTELCRMWLGPSIEELRNRITERSELGRTTLTNMSARKDASTQGLTV